MRGAAAPGVVVPVTPTAHITSVAIVEDNATVRQTLARWVNETADCRCVCTCSTAEEALAKLPRVAPEVVLMDIQLPNLSGIASWEMSPNGWDAIQIAYPFTAKENQARAFLAAIQLPTPDM